MKPFTESPVENQSSTNQRELCLPWVHHGSEKAASARPPRQKHAQASPRLAHAILRPNIRLPQGPYLASPEIAATPLPPPRNSKLLIVLDQAAAAPI